MACSDQVTTQRLIEAELDAVTIGEIATSKTGASSTGADISTSTSRFGTVTKTMKGRSDDLDTKEVQYTTDLNTSADAFDALALQRVNEIGVIYDSPLRPWSASLLVDDLRAHTHLGETYIPKTTLPFTTGATFDVNNWSLLQGITNGDLINDLSQTYNAVTKAIAESVTLPLNKIVDLKEVISGDGNGGTYIVTSTAPTVIEELKNGQAFGTGGTKYKYLALAIRQDTAGVGWYALDDANHFPTGFSSLVENANGTISILYDFVSSKRSSLVATTDETFAGTGLTFGSSVGANAATFTLYMPLSLRISNVSAAFHNWNGVASGNVSADFTDAVSLGKVIVTHPSITHSDSVGPPISINKYVPQGNSEYALTDVSKSGFTVQAMGGLGGKITVSGGSPAVTTDNITPFAATWDGTSTLTIDHQTAASANDISIDGGGKFHPVITGTPTKAQVKMQFYDLTTGALYVGAVMAATMVVQFNRLSNVPTSWSDGTRIQLERNVIKVNATDVANSSANIWIYGMFEV